MELTLENESLDQVGLQRQDMKSKVHDHSFVCLLIICNHVMWQLLGG